MQITQTWKDRDFRFPAWHRNSKEVFTSSQQVKSWTDWKSTTSLRPIREMRSQGKALPTKIKERGRHREPQHTRAEISAGTSTGNRNSYPGTDRFMVSVRMTLRDRNSRATGQRRPHCAAECQGPHYVLTACNRETHSCSGMGQRHHP